MPSGGSSNTSSARSSNSGSLKSNDDYGSTECAIDEFLFQNKLLEYGYYLTLGRRRSGKTTCMRQVSQHLKNTNTSQHIVITGNEKIKKLWGEIVHPIYIHDPSLEILRRIIAEQNRRIKECEVLGVPFPPEWKVTLWIDDCGTLKWFMHSQEMKWLSSNGRNINMDIFILVQKLTHPCTESRENSDGVISLQTQHKKTLQLLHDEFASCIKMPLFQAIFAGATRERGMVVINAHPERPIVQDMFAFSHCDLLHEDGYEGKLKRIGSDMHWKYAEENYKPPISTIPLSSVIEKPHQQSAMEGSGAASFPDSDEDEEVADGNVRFTGLPFHQGGYTVKFNRKTFHDDHL